MRLRAFIAAYPGTLLAVLSACAAVLFFTGSFLKWQAARQEQTVAREAQRAASAQAHRATEMARLKRHIGPYAEQLERLRTRVRVETREGNVLSALQTLSQSSGIRLSSFRMEEHAPVGGYIIRVAYIELQGEYGALRRFLRGVDELPMAVMIGNAILEKDSGGARQLRATVEVFTFALGSGGE